MGGLTPPSSRLVVRSTGPPAVSSGSGKAKSCLSWKRCSSLAVAAAGFLVGPPPGLVAGFGVGWVVLGHGAFVDEGFPSFVPGVQGLTPTHRFLDGMDPGELVGESLEFLAGLKSWFECQVGFGVALHVHQAASDARARPARHGRLSARREGRR